MNAPSQRLQIEKAREKQWLVFFTEKLAQVHLVPAFRILNEGSHFCNATTIACIKKYQLGYLHFHAQGMNALWNTLDPGCKVYV